MTIPKLKDCCLNQYHFGENINYNLDIGNIYAIPSVSIAGISLEIGLYGDLDLSIAFNFKASFDGEMTITASVTNSMTYPLNFRL